MFYAITNLDKPHQYAAKARRVYRDVAVRGNTVAIEADRQPWAELAGHMTISTQIVNVRADDAASAAKEYKS